MISASPFVPTKTFSACDECGISFNLFEVFTNVHKTHKLILCRRHLPEKWRKRSKHA